MGRGNVAPEDIVWAGIARSRPRLESWSALDEDDRLFAHVLVLGPDAAGCADAVRAAIGEHDVDFEDFVYLEPLADRVARGVIDQDWAATAGGLGGTYTVSTGVFDTYDSVRPRSSSRRSALWGGSVSSATPVRISSTSGSFTSRSRRSPSCRPCGSASGTPPPCTRAPIVATAGPERLRSGPR